MPSFGATARAALPCRPRATRPSTRGTPTTESRRHRVQQSWSAGHNNQMNHKELANTGIRLAEIGLGTWHYESGVEPLRTGIALGACFIDTAESYGTEEVVGRAIQGTRNKVFVATKVSPRHFRRSDVIRSAEASLRRLKTDYIDLYQLHWPNYAVPIEETMAAMEALVERGKVRFIGVSNFSVTDLKKAQAALSKYKIASNQVRYNLIDRTVEDGLLHYCREHDIAVLAYSPLAHGLGHIKERDRGQILRRVSAMTGKSEAQVALNWCISRAGVVVIPTASSIGHVEDDCGACDWRLSDDHIGLLDRGIKFSRRGYGETTLRE